METMKIFNDFNGEITCDFSARHHVLSNLDRVHSNNCASTKNQDQSLRSFVHFTVVKQCLICSLQRTLDRSSVHERIGVYGYFINFLCSLSDDEIFSSSTSCYIDFTKYFIVNGIVGDILSYLDDSARVVLLRNEWRFKPHLTRHSTEVSEPHVLLPGSDLMM